jgi:hypothetical protein
VVLQHLKKEKKKRGIKNTTITEPLIPNKLGYAKTNPKITKIIDLKDKNNDNNSDNCNASNDYDMIIIIILIIVIAVIIVILVATVTVIII